MKKVIVKSQASLLRDVRAECSRLIDAENWRYEKLARLERKKLRDPSIVIKDTMDIIDDDIEAIRTRCNELEAEIEALDGFEAIRDYYWSYEVTHDESVTSSS